MLAVLCSLAILSTAGLHVLLAITDESSGNQRTGMIEFGPICGANQALDATISTSQKTNMFPSNRLFQSEIHLPTLDVQGKFVSFTAVK